MSYQIEEVKLSQQIFYHLLSQRELNEQQDKALYYAYTGNETVMNLVKSQGEIANCVIERYGSSIYLIPKEENEVLGFSKRELIIAERLKEGATYYDEEQQQQLGIAYSNMLEAFEALRSDDRGSKQKTTKEGFLHGIFKFLQEQQLIEYIEADEMITTTKKLDQLMDFNLLNQNNYTRVLHVLKEAENESN